MAGGEPFTAAEIDLMARSIMRAEKQAETIRRYRAAFPDSDRTDASLRAYRSRPVVMRRVHFLCDLLGDMRPEDVDAGPRVEVSEQAGEGVTVSTPKGLRLVKPAMLLEKAGIAYELHEGDGDPRIVPLHFHLEHVKLNQWPTAMKGPDGDPVQIENYQTTVKLKRRSDAPMLKAMEAVLERASEASPTVPLRHKTKPESGHLLEVSIPDLHVGKLAHAREAGQDYDSHIARRRFTEALADILDRASYYPVEQILFLVGSDLLHTDNEAGTTFAGTPQDVDSRQHKMLETAYEMLIAGIGEASRLAPVTAKTVPGNHDRHEALAAGRYLKAWFREDENVEVEAEPKSRKYHEYGRCFIGLAHGDEEKPKTLPLVMAQEMPEAWGRTRYREWHIGHVHHKKEIQALTVHEETGVRVRHLPSLSRTDAWHARKGYMAQQAAEAFVWHPERGLQDIIHHTPDHWGTDAA